MGSSVEIGMLSVTMDRADGAGVENSYFNATDKEIKYLTFVYVPYNQVGDQVQCTISKKIKASCKLTGPIKPYEQGYVTWDSLWYNPTVTRVELVQLHVEYMDGTEETIDGADVVNIYDKNSVYYEKIEKPKAAKRAEDEKRRAIERAEREKKEAIERAEKARKAELMQAYLCFKVFSCLKKAKSDKEMAFHANQGLWLFFLEVIALICCIADPVIGCGVGVALGALAIYLSLKGAAGIRDNTRYEIPLISKIKLVK